MRNRGFFGLLLGKISPFMGWLNVAKVPGLLTDLSLPFTPPEV